MGWCAKNAHHQARNAEKEQGLGAVMSGGQPRTLRSRQLLARDRSCHLRLAPLLTLLPMAAGHHRAARDQVEGRTQLDCISSTHQETLGRLWHRGRPDARRTPSQREDRFENFADDHRCEQTKRKRFAVERFVLPAQFPPGLLVG